MADQTVRTIYQANVAQAQRSMTSLAKDTDKAADSVDKLDKGLDSAGKKSVKPKIDIDIAKAEAEVRKLTSELEKLEANPTDPVLDIDIAKSQAKIETLERELQVLSRMDASPQVDADVAKAEAQIEGLQSRIRAMEGLNAEVEVTVASESARSDLDAAESKLKALQGAKAEMVVTADAGAAEEVFDDLDGAGADAGAKAGEEAGNAIIAGLNSTPIVGAVSGILVGVGAYLGKQLMDDIQNAIANEDVFGSRTGLDEATARKFGTAAGLAYSNAWGDSLEANMGTAQSALENALVLPDSTGREIQGVIEQLTAVSEILGSDITETAEAAGNMIKNGLAKDATEAFDIIITGQQNGLNRSEDWLDTLREYSGMFESIGLSGAEAGGLIEQAMDAGARNSDVAADALKEFSIRAQDDSKATNAAFESLGLNADKMGKDIAKGGDTASAGLDTVLDALRKIEDPIARNAAGVALFGTMWEDMGNGAGVLAMDLDGLGDSWVNVGDTSADAMARMSDNAASAWESTKRTFETSLDTVLGGIAIAFEEPLGELSGWMSTHTNEILGFLIDLGYGFFDLARAAVEFAATTIEVMGDVAGSLDGITRHIGLVVEGIGVMTGDNDIAALGEDIQSAADDMETFGESSEGMADKLRTDVGGALDEAEGRFADFTGPALMQTAINDSINEMIADTDRFVAHVADMPDAKITINGDTLEGEEALNALITEVSESNGTVTINGETVPVEQAMDEVLRLGEAGIEVEVTANTDPAKSQLDGIMTEPPTVEVPVTADTAPAQEEVTIWGSQVGDVPATVYVESDLYGAEETLEAFYAEMQDQDWTVDINGQTVDAEQALGILLEEVNAGEGTVMINGTPVNAESSLLQLIDIINASDGTVTIDGNNVPANLKTDQAKAKADGTTGTVDIEGDNSGANASTDSAKRKADGTTGTMDVDGNNSGANAATDSAKRKADRTTGTIDVNARTAGANAAIAAAAATRTAYINVVARNVGANLGSFAARIGRARGGRIDGYSSGYGSGYGVVPGPSAPYGVDNVLWPDYSGATAKGLATGGPVLDRPLAGGEWVVNPVSSKQHDSLLAAINAGATRSQIAASFGAGGGSSVAQIDQGGLESAVVRGLSQATVIAQVSDRVAANLYQRGASASRAFGGAS